MLGTPPPTGPTVDTAARQQNQLLQNPGMSGLPQPGTPSGGSLFPQVNSAVSQSPLLQQSNDKIAQMVQALMRAGGGG